MSLPSERRQLIERKKFLLYGIAGVYNYGCESIVRGVEIALRHIWPDCDILYVSESVEDDRRRLVGSDVQVLGADRAPRGSLRWLVNRFLREFYWGSLYPRERGSWVHEIDCFLSIGGDLYTLPGAPYLTPKKRFRDTHLLDIGEWVMKRGRATVIWGGSIGPFEQWPSAKRLFLRHLRRIDLITVREPDTWAYLRSLGLEENVVLVADPAFLVPPVPCRLERLDGSVPLVGINLSPFSARHRFGGRAVASVIHAQAEALVRLIETLGVEIVLLPHSVNDSRPDDDDRQYLRTIYGAVACRCPERVSMVADDPRAERMKGILAQCDVVVAARMHCGIHAVSVGTPAVFLAYSDKAWGMSRFIYGDDSYCVPLDALTDGRAERKIEALLAERIRLSEYLKRKGPEFVNQALDAAVHIEEMLRARSGPLS